MKNLTMWKKWQSKASAAASIVAQWHRGGCCLQQGYSKSHIDGLIPERVLQEVGDFNFQAILSKGMQILYRCWCTRSFHRCSAKTGFLRGLPPFMLLRDCVKKCHSEDRQDNQSRELKTHTLVWTHALSSCLLAVSVCRSHKSMLCCQ